MRYTMHNRPAVSVLRISIFSIWLSLRGQSMPTIILSPDPDPRVSLQSYSDNLFPQFKVAMSSEVGLQKPILVTVTNRSQQPMMTATVVWRAKDATGRERKFVTTCDGYANRTPNPIALPGVAALVGPQTCMSAEAAARHARGGIVEARPDPKGHLMAIVSQSTQVSINLDSA